MDEAIEGRGKVEEKEDASAPLVIHPYAAADALAAAAVELSAPALLDARGPVAKARSMVARGMAPTDAVTKASQAGKGFVAEVNQAASFTARSAMTGGGLRAELNPAPNDPLADVHVYAGSDLITSAQIKTGDRAYIDKSLAKPGYGTTIVPSERLGQIQRTETASGSPVTDRLAVGGVEAAPLSEKESATTARRLIQRLLERDDVRAAVDALPLALRAGSREATLAMWFSAGESIFRAFFLDQKVDLRDATKDALVRGGRAMARGTARSWIEISALLSTPGSALSNLARVAGSSETAGAVAEVAVVTAEELLRLAFGNRTGREATRRIGVGACAAIGSAAAYAATKRLVKDWPWALRVGALCGASYAGSRLGSEIGAVLFLGGDSPATASHPAKPALPEASDWGTDVAQPSADRDSRSKPVSSRA